MNRILTYTMLAALAAYSSQAVAATPVASANKPAGKKIEDMIAELKAKDKDNNGYITREEAKAYRFQKRKEKMAAKAAKAAAKK